MVLSRVWKGITESSDVWRAAIKLELLNIFYLIIIFLYHDEAGRPTVYQATLGLFSDVKRGFRRKYRRHDDEQTTAKIGKEYFDDVGPKKKKVLRQTG